MKTRHMLIVSDLESRLPGRGNDARKMACLITEATMTQSPLMALSGILAVVMMIIGLVFASVVGFIFSAVMSAVIVMFSFWVTSGDRREFSRKMDELHAMVENDAELRAALDKVFEKYHIPRLPQHQAMRKAGESR